MPLLSCYCEDFYDLPTLVKGFQQNYGDLNRLRKQVNSNFIKNENEYIDYFNRISCDDKSIYFEYVSILLSRKNLENFISKVKTPCKNVSFEIIKKFIDFEKEIPLAYREIIFEEIEKPSGIEHLGISVMAWAAMGLDDKERIAANNLTYKDDVVLASVEVLEGIDDISKNTKNKINKAILIVRRKINIKSSINRRYNLRDDKSQAENLLIRLEELLEK